MRKYRSWLMGLGIGLILGASMLQLILVAKDQAVRVTDQTLTRDQLEVQAEKAELILLPANETRYTQKELDAKVKEAVANAQVDGKPASKAEDVVKDTTSKSAGETSDVKPSSTLEEPDSGDPKAVTLYVRYTMTLTEVAEELEKLGVIEDKDDFIAKAWSISKKLNVGTSVFTGKPSYKQIMNELIRKKD